MNALEIASGVLVLIGASFSVIAAIGVWRFPDVFARMHAATKTATFGLLVILTGAAFRMKTEPDIIKLALVFAFQLLTAPIAAHMIGRAAYRSGGSLSSSTVLDELATRPPDTETEPDGR
ncbi:MAG TPA: monovalent cation/H(+) antiporter subunit G [Acidimicrobiia bacterium]|nr:monovalent cation/H(+) antiporter subunit G [Acidimicrobiia bacterium]